MRLYLTQHGEALSKEQNPERPLSEKGRMDVGRIASFLRTSSISLLRVAHSGKTRAKQTAEILGARLALGKEIEEMSGIDPLDPPALVAEQVSEWSEDTLLVGHQPFMGKMVSLLVSANEELSVVGFRPGSVVCLERDGDDNWSVVWMLRPELLSAIQ